MDFGTSENVAAGNLTIILEVAPPFVRWLNEIERAGGPTCSAFEATMADPRLRAAPNLAGAITAYQAAIELPAYLGGGRFPTPLATLSNIELVALATLYVQSVTDDASSSDAWSWESFEQRMGFIMTFFRAYQRDIRIFDVPIEYLPLEDL